MSTEISMEQSWQFNLKMSKAGKQNAGQKVHGLPIASTSKKGGGWTLPCLDWITITAIVVSATPKPLFLSRNIIYDV